MVGRPEKPKEAPVQTLPFCPIPSKEIPTQTTPSKNVRIFVGTPKIIDCEDWYPKDWCGITVLPKSFWVDEEFNKEKITF